MNTKHITLSLCTLAGLMATVCSTTQPVMAQARPALVKSVDEKGRNPYQVTLDCLRKYPYDIACAATIDPVPAGKRLVLQFVHATIGFSTAPEITLQADPNSSKPVILADFPPTVIDSMLHKSVINYSILFYVDPGKTISLVVQYLGGDRSYSSVTFTGYLVDLE